MGRHLRTSARIEDFSPAKVTASPRPRPPLPRPRRGGRERREGKGGSGPAPEPAPARPGTRPERRGGSAAAKWRRWPRALSASCPRLLLGAHRAPRCRRPPPALSLFTPPPRLPAPRLAGPARADRLYLPAPRLPPWAWSRRIAGPAPHLLPAGKQPPCPSCGACFVPGLVRLAGGVSHACWQRTTILGGVLTRWFSFVSQYVIKRYNKK